MSTEQETQLWPAIENLTDGQCLDRVRAVYEDFYKGTESFDSEWSAQLVYLLGAITTRGFVMLDPTPPSSTLAFYEMLREFYADEHWVWDYCEVMLSEEDGDETAPME